MPPPTGKKCDDGTISLEKGVDEGCGAGSPRQQQGPHQQEGQQNRQKPPFFVFLEENPEFLKKSTSGIGGLLFEFGGLFVTH